MADDTENTPPQQRGLVPWKPGQSGNPKGRPKGSRNKLGEQVVEDILADWQAGGVEAIERTRKERPADYLRTIVSILPKEVKIEHVDEMTDEQLTNRARQLCAELGIAIGLVEGVGQDAGSQEAETKPH